MINKQQIIFTNAMSSNVLIFEEGRTYYNNPSEAPKGVALKRGPRGGYYTEEPVGKKDGGKATATNIGKKVTLTDGREGTIKSVNGQFTDVELKDGTTLTVGGGYAVDIAKSKEPSTKAELEEPEDDYDEIHPHAADGPTEKDNREFSIGDRIPDKKEPSAPVERKNMIQEMGWDSQEDMMVDLAGRPYDLPDEIGEDYGEYISGILDENAIEGEEVMDILGWSVAEPGYGLIFDFELENGDKEQITLHTNGRLTDQNGKTLKNEDDEVIFVSEDQVYSKNEEPSAPAEKSQVQQDKEDEEMWGKPESEGKGENEQQHATLTAMRKKVTDEIKRKASTWEEYNKMIADSDEIKHFDRELDKIVRKKISERN